MAVHRPPISSKRKADGTHIVNSRLELHQIGVLVWRHRDLLAGIPARVPLVQFYLSTYFKKFIVVLSYPNHPPIVHDKIKEFSGHADDFRDID